MGNHYAYELAKLQSWELIEGTHAAIQTNILKNFRDVGCKVRDLIHGIPSSYTNDDFAVSQMEIYLGCARADRLFQRFSEHRDNKGHEFGVIIGTCKIENASYLEAVGIKFLNKLKDSGKLCVRNATTLGYKGHSTDKIILIYMTWKIDRRRIDTWNPPSKTERDIICKELISGVRQSAEGQPSTWREHIRDVVDEIHKKTAKETVTWHKNHLD